MTSAIPTTSSTTDPAASTASTTSTSTSTSTDDLVSAHLPLVAHVVRDTMGRVPGHVSRDDLTSAGLMALVQAAQGFDASRGIPFPGYAVPRIRGAVLDELRRVDWASRSVRRTARSIEGARAELAAALGRPATDQEVADSLGVTLEDLSRNEHDTARASVLSLHASEELDLAGTLPASGPTPEQEVEHRERLTYLAEAVAELPERMRVVVEQYFLAERPMAEIAAELGVSESRISQIRAEALVLLRGALHRELEPELAPAPARAEGCAARRRESYYAAVAARHATGLERGRMRYRLDESA